MNQVLCLTPKHAPVHHRDVARGRPLPQLVRKTTSLRKLLNPKHFCLQPKWLSVCPGEMSFCYSPAGLRPGPSCHLASRYGKRGRVGGPSITCPVAAPAPSTKPAPPLLAPLPSSHTGFLVLSETQEVPTSRPWPWPLPLPGSALSSGSHMAHALTSFKSSHNVTVSARPRLATTSPSPALRFHCSCHLLQCYLIITDLVYNLLSAFPHKSTPSNGRI